MPPRSDSSPSATPSPFPTLGSGAATTFGTVREPHDIAARPRAEASAPLLPIVALSILAHGLLALALGALGIAPALALEQETFVEFSLAAPPEPIALAEPIEPLEPEPAAIAPPPPVERERPRPLAEAEPPPVPTAAPPSLDEVFGSDPAPPAEVMTTEGAGGFAIDPGVPGGVPGGRAGGTGEGVGSVGAAAGTPAGPGEAARRRARRLYVRPLEGLLHGRIRYPRALERAGVGGRVELCIRVGDDGRVIGSRVCASAGHDQLDEAALSAAHELDRVPAPPALAAWSPGDEIHAGIVFAVR